MRIKSIIDEDFINYKKPSMFIGTCKCDWKCYKEAGLPPESCPNFIWRDMKIFDFDNKSIVERYMNNPLTDAIVIGGLEPFDQFTEMRELITEFRKQTSDDIVIYTGYNKDEVLIDLPYLKFKNIIIKFGRYKPNCEKHFDDILGVYLASDNQYGERIS